MFDIRLNGVFNTVMSLEQDQALIASLGGPSEVARQLGYGQGGAQRVHNWLRRGIPASVKLERPDLFLRGLRIKRDKAGV